MWWNQVSKDSDVVVSTRVRFARNLKDFKFPNNIDEKTANKVIDIIANCIDKSEYKVFKMKDIDEITRYSLMEQHLISKEFVENVSIEALISNDDNTLVTMINEEDHLRIQAFESGFNIDNCYDRLVKFTNELSKKLEFAVDEDYGYLTACPTNIGSGMRVSIMLHLPALAKLGFLSKLLEEASNVGVSVRGLYGENTSGHGNIFQLSNQHTLGEKDSETILRLKAIIFSIIDQERKAREVLMQNSIQLEDEIYRIYGVLKMARILSVQEAIKLLSKLRLGVSIGILKEVSLEKIQNLIVQINTNTLKLLLKKDFNEYDENINRAEYVRKELN